MCSVSDFHHLFAKHQSGNLHSGGHQRAPQHLFTDCNVGVGLMGGVELIHDGSFHNVSDAVLSSCLSANLGGERFG